MATAAKPVLSDIHSRLDRLEARIADIRATGSIEHEGFDDDISQFADRHLSIRSMIDETASDSALAKADQQTSDLEEGIERWIAGVDEKFAKGAPRIDSVSM